MHRILTAVLTIFSLSLYADDLEPAGQFLNDSLKIGQPIKFSLSVYHPSQTQVLFPDSGYNFSNFELIRKEYFPTITVNNQSFDSAVYVFRSFSLAPSQYLSLPVFMVKGEDSLVYYSLTDTAYLQQYLPDIPLSLDLKNQTELSPLEQNLNYPYLLAYTLGALAAASILYFTFGKAINRRYKLFKVRNDHMVFVKNYQKLQDEFTKAKATPSIEQALSMWKGYLARLENKPINTYTSTEIINLYNKEELKNGLNIIDRAIYGGVISDEAEKALTTLKRFSNRLYHKRKKEIQDV